MFIKNGDDPNSKIISVVNTENDAILDDEVKIALEKVKSTMSDKKINDSLNKDAEKN